MKTKNARKARPLAVSRAICTIATTNFLAQAETFVNSYLGVHQDGRAFVLLLGDLPEKKPFNSNRVEIIRFEDLIRADLDLAHVAFKYKPFELCCALKSYFLKYLLENRSVERLLYFDSDIYITARLDEIFDRFDEYSILLTPHLIDPEHELRGSLLPNETSISLTGTYNAGFLGVKSDEEALRFLAWWQSRVFEKCAHDVHNGYFVDQKWLDFVPGLFPQAHLLRHHGCNVGFWNLHEKTFSLDTHGRILSNGTPLLFFHFSGYQPQSPHLISRHQNRHTLNHDRILHGLFKIYGAQLAEHTDASSMSLSPGFNRFDNGLEIPNFVRDLYARVEKRRRNFGNPFATADAKSFFSWLTSSHGSVVPPLVVEMRTRRKDISAAFPYPAEEKIQLGLFKWAANSGAAELGLSPEWGRLLKQKYAAALARFVSTKKPDYPQGTDSMDFSASSKEPPLSFGVNLAGFFQSEKGLGSSVRGSELCLIQASVPYVKNNILDRRSQNLFKLSHLDFTERNPFMINLIHAPAAATPEVLQSKGSDYFQSRLNIGYWAWEFPEFPENLQRWFKYFDEIWVPSTFVQQAIARVAPVPVVCIPHSLNAEDLSEIPAPVRKKGPFTFLFCFDFESYHVRKNPQGLLKAFIKAFGAKPAKDVQLVIKMSHGEKHQAAYNNLKNLAARDSRISIINSVISPEKVRALMKEADCYISLHRAEGFGLTMLEAMALGKPVIATGYSGNVEFMNSENSYLIPYRMTKVSESFGPYTPQMSWAEPDLEAAAEAMKNVVENRKEAAERGLRGAEHVRTHFSPKAIAKLYAERLQHIAARPVRHSP